MKVKGLFQKATVAGETGLNAVGLFPVDRRAADIVSRMRDQKALMWVHTARYPEHHRYAFAIMQKIADAIGVPVEVVLLSLKRETGRFDYVQLVDGTIVENPHSIAFESMDQAEFQKFWDDVLVVLTEKWMGKMADDVFEEIRDMIAGKVNA